MTWFEIALSAGVAGFLILAIYKDHQFKEASTAWNRASKNAASATADKYELVQVLHRLKKQHTAMAADLQYALLAFDPEGARQYYDPTYKNPLDQVRHKNVS